ncbi:MAG: proline--tRNA ligase [Candidatus Omnitrophica bacterium]|nr:proline--tRNA ligase [Candidatus Omnitrophota bacterium]
MRWSRSFIPTIKEDPQEAEAISHKLMVRAGLIRRLTAGAYSYLPMGFRALEKAQKIISEEMNAAGAAQLLMPALQPIELWERTGRDKVIGDVMIRFIDRHGRQIALGPTHEEVVTDIVAHEVRSYKDLPVILYQIQSKFRDEIRPRFGVVRSSEFIMKDAYSFDVDAEGLEESYKKMFAAYCRIFERCALPYVPVEADSGMMGGSVSHEFMVPSEIGEDRIAVCSSCKYSASLEVAPVVHNEDDPGMNSAKDVLGEVSTPGSSSVKDVSAYLKVKESDLIKTLIFKADDIPLAVLLRGDHDANETKIKKELGIRTLSLADAALVEKVTGGAMGFSGPLGLSIPVYADNSIREAKNWVAGANKKDTHLVNVCNDRDFKVSKFIDARLITGDDPCPKCGKKIEVKNAVEIGHTFKLGTKYSEPLGAGYLDRNGVQKPIVMGCYGIGVNRILATCIETSHDKDGIIWPKSLAPFAVVVIPLNRDDAEVSRISEKIYAELLRENVEVLLDDRDNKSPGVKFKDSDLVGFPLQVIIGKKSLENGKIEIKTRKTGEKSLVDIDMAVTCIKKMVSNAVS